MAETLIKIGELARRANVPIATVKHYLREGLIRPERKSGKTMSWYSPSLVDRLRAIKELQERRFLPLDVIKKTIDRHEGADDDLAAAEAIAKVLAKHGGDRTCSRDEVLANGAESRELRWLELMGLAVPSGEDSRYGGDDLALLSTLASARRAGIGAEMLPFAILEKYLAALQALVAVELEMFRAGVFPHATPDQIGPLTEAATQLSERLVILLRRKLLLPTLNRLAEENRHAKNPARATPARRGMRQQLRRHATGNRRGRTGR